MKTTRHTVKSSHQQHREFPSEGQTTYASAVLCAFIERKQATFAFLKINDENEEPKVVKPKTAPQKSSVENKTPKNY